MKTTLVILSAALLLSCTGCGPAEPADAIPGVTYDAEKHSVTFTAVSTDCGIDAQLEFLFVGPGSDHDYEAMFVTEAEVADIAKAFDLAGIPRGRDINAFDCRFWPVGSVLTLEPGITNFVRETREGLLPEILFTGGARDLSDVPVAHTNSPESVFAFYNLAQSLIQFNDFLDQSAAYGRFMPAVKIPKGEKRTFTLTWTGKPAYETVTLALAPGNMAEALKGLQEKAEKSELDVCVDFSPDLTLKEAAADALALSMIDSVRVKLNGTKEGQFFYHAFLPLEAWREPTGRLAQPPEIHLKGDGTVEVVETIEDWSDDDSLDAKLTRKVHACASDAEAGRIASPIADKTLTVFIFAPPETKLGRLYELKKHVTGTVPNWYLFSEFRSE